MTRTLELLEHLIAFPTVSHQSNLDLIDWAQDLLQTAGFDVTRIYAPDRAKAGLFARLGPATDGGVCLSGHTDVVPAEGQQWTRDAFSLTRDRTHVFGRGTTDMKGFLASALALAERAQDVRLVKPLSLVLSYDEEIGCVGLGEMLPRLTPLIGKPRVVIVGEPTSMQLATGHKGKATLKVTCHGETGHSALAPHFVNAIHLAAAFVDEARHLQSKLSQGPCDPAYDIPYSTVHIGKIAGGRALNIVPDLVSMDMEFRHLPGTAAADLLEAINAAATHVGDLFQRPDAISVQQINAYPGLNLSADNPVIDWVRGLANGGAPTKVAFGTEAGYFAQLGLDALVVGPGDMASDGHKPDEALALTQLAACDAMMDRILQSLACQNTI
ncbi:acetylornithine deacetylase [Roseobacter weihaiensis]|uniref:acetylornithine deacetylase n=1 Tax=Roseobacter weihaiensis TaxID=2763262 RepID=UPI001D0BA87B|nr:acetylornithine deacetylase [Roseobacter sp. H9]